MTLEERIKLINAGYTKEEISAMEAPAKAEEKKEPEKAKPEEKKSENDFSSILAAEIAKALAAAMPKPEEKPEPEKKEEKKTEKKEEKNSDDEVIKKLVAEQLKTFFQPSIKIDPVTDLSDITKRLFEVKISKEGEN